VTSRDTVTEIEKRACHEFLIDGNRVQACMRAGYSKRSAHSHAHRIFARPRVIAYLAPLLEKLHAKTLAKVEDVLQELSNIALSNLADYFKKVTKGKKTIWVMKELDELTKAQQSVISEFEPEKRLRLHNKDGALDKLAKHYKLYTDLEAGATNFNMMPTLRISGKEIIFEVGRPAPEPPLKN
jgi:phage terminase small subunit